MELRPERVHQAWNKELTELGPLAHSPGGFGEVQTLSKGRKQHFENSGAHELHTHRLSKKRILVMKYNIISTYNFAGIFFMSITWVILLSLCVSDTQNLKQLYFTFSFLTSTTLHFKANIYFIYLITVVNSFLVDYMLNQNQGHALIILLTESQIKKNMFCGDFKFRSFMFGKLFWKKKNHNSLSAHTDLFWKKKLIFNFNLFFSKILIIRNC